MSEWDRIIANMHNSEDIDLAVTAYEALDKASDASWLPRLHDLLANGKDFFVREAAAYPIARLDGIAALRQLLHAKRLGEQEGYDNDGMVALICDLVSANQAEAAPILEQMIGDSSERQREDAAWLWGFAANALGPEPLFPLASDSSPRVRAAALGSLASFSGREDVFCTLMHGIHDSSDEVRVSAASSLGYYGDRRAVSRLQEMLSTASVRSRGFLESAIQQLTKWSS